MWVSGKENLYIGIDLGTSAVKLILMDGKGKIHKIVSKEYPLYFPHPGWPEQKPEDWYEQTMAGMKELLAETDKTRVAGISFGGQMHGLVILDKEGRVIRPAILWSDGRTFEECDDLNNVIGKERLFRYMGTLHVSKRLCCQRIIWYISLSGCIVPMSPMLPDFAEELGLSHMVKVAAGAGDNAAAAVGTGTVGEGMCNISLGTSGRACGKI